MNTVVSVCARCVRIDIALWLQANTTSSRESAEAIYAEEAAKPDGPGPARQYVVETLAAEWVGFTGFNAERAGDAGGYFFAAEPLRGQGYGLEMVECVLRVMFEDCGAARCVIDYHDWNEAAAHLYTKLGFIEEMHILIREERLEDEDRRMAPGRPVYAVVMVLTRERFLERLPAPGE